jgi:hypothetical protein
LQKKEEREGKYQLINKEGEKGLKAVAKRENSRFSFAVLCDKEKERNSL